jgi:hypothetical protein
MLHYLQTKLGKAEPGLWPNACTKCGGDLVLYKTCETCRPMWTCLTCNGKG